MDISAFGISIHEADVALTDYLLSLEGLVLSRAIYRRKHPGEAKRELSAALFLSLAFSSFLGGTFHAFFPLKMATRGGWLLWMTTLFAIGLTAVTLWLLDLDWALGSSARRRGQPAVLAIFMGYVAYFLFIDHAFRTALVFYLPPLLVLLGLFLVKADGLKISSHRWGAGGIVLTFVAAAAQFFRIAIHPIYFNHNALYHLIQAVALWFLFVGLKGLNIHYPPRQG